MSISLRAIKMIRRTFQNFKSFSLFTSCCYFKGVTNEIRNKSVVALTENSDHDRITSMSCLKKVIDTVETECGKSFTNLVLWSDSMDTQFRSRFIFQLLAGTIFLNKSFCWFYNRWLRWNHQKRHSPNSKVRPDCGPYTQRLFWCWHEICAIYYYCLLA